MIELRTADARVRGDPLRAVLPSVPCEVLDRARSAALGARAVGTHACQARSKLLAEDEPIRIRLTAAKSLVELDHGIHPAPFLVECMMSNAAEAVTAETTLFAWLGQKGKAGNRVADEIARAWHPPKAGLPPDPRDADRVEREQRIERATILRKQLDELRE